MSWSLRRDAFLASRDGERQLMREASTSLRNGCACPFLDRAEDVLAFVLAARFELRVLAGGDR